MGWADPRPEATAWYWDSAYDAHRTVLLDTIGRAGSFASVLEIGSHCGPNLRRMRERFGPDFCYLGVDCNALAVSDGEIKFAADWNAGFQVGTVPDDLDRFANGSYDVVLSSACLTCVQPTDLQRTLSTMRRIARVAVVCQELRGHGEWVDGTGWAHTYPEWVVTC